MAVGSYIERRGELETYFDRTAADTWAKLTSDAPVSGIRATVRAGRDEMRNTLLSWLPDDMTGMRLLDAGCGTGALSIAAARRGAHVLAIDLSPTLVNVARERLPEEIDPAAIDFRSGDMLDPALGEFDFVVAMDSLIHYLPHDICKMLATLASRTRRSMAVTFAPKTPLLAAMHFVGGFFPRADRAPAIEPISEAKLRDLIAADPALQSWHPGRTHRVSRGFYTSQALEMVPR
ncbi:magnesium protoporphyrin IX methyltransferase [Rhodopseudomonas sp. B29]|uniref:magnesium protoporphyrin IX methyltransferase n=1 Tax=Rhodopseudomonas sp. B29 TaxID=95607 RepID=UPI0003B59A8F|nr:magnesium protoporphyrin IX methyltransferase [Rhodopseudomonas sp. B29]